MPLTTSFAITGTATGLDSTGNRTMMARTTQLFPYPVFAGLGADDAKAQDKHVPPPPPEQGVIDHGLDHLAVRDQPRHDQKGHRQPQVIGFPPGAGEEGVRTVMRPQAGKPRPGQHPAHRALPRLPR